MSKLVVTICSLSLMSNISSDALRASEVAQDSSITSEEKIIPAAYTHEPAKRKLAPRNLSTDKKFEILAEKLDHLTACADELCCKNTHISSDAQEYLEGALSGFFISGDFLYWQADEDKLEYAINFQGGFGNSQTAIDQFNGLHFEWNPGFRVSIGGTSCNCDNWGIYANYTQIRNKAHGSVHSNPAIATNFIYPTQDQPSLGFATLGAHARWSVDYSTEHLEAFKDYFAGRHLIFRPHAGLINANINQESHISYDLIPDLFPNFPESKVHAKCNYWGLGVGGGADILWHFTPHFGIYGEFSLGLLYGKFNVRSNAETAHRDTGVPFSIHFKKEMWRTRATMQTALGLEWETIFNRDRNRIAISLGYEFNEWFRQNQFVVGDHNTVGTTLIIKNAPLVAYYFANADLAFKGGTLRATFNF